MLNKVTKMTKDPQKKLIKKKQSTKLGLDKIYLIS